MPFPNYTEAECTDAITDIDAKLAEMRGLTDFRIGNKGFAQIQRARAELLAEREEWVRRYYAVKEGRHPLQGPRLDPV